MPLTPTLTWNLVEASRSEVVTADAVTLGLPPQLPTGVPVVCRVGGTAPYPVKLNPVHCLLTRATEAMGTWPTRFDEADLNTVLPLLELVQDHSCSHTESVATLK